MAIISNAASIIWTLPFFSDLGSQQKSELLRVASFKHCKRGEMLFLQGAALTHFYWVCRGVVQIFRETPDGHELTGGIRIVGDMLFNPDALHSRNTQAANARAVKETMLLAIPVKWVTEHLGADARLANRFFTIMVKRAQEAQIEIEHQATMNATQIVNCFLQHLCALHNFNPRNFKLPYTKTLIASRLNMELETLSRVMTKLKEFGIMVKGNNVSFTDISTAQHHSCDSCSVGEECRPRQIMQELAQKHSFRIPETIN